MDPFKDKVIELAMVPFEYDDSGKIYRVLPAYNSLQDPGIPISPLITSITGITNEMVKGHQIDLQEVAKLVESADLVIAHNARFDRPFVELLSDSFKNIDWACSIADINWNEEGMEGVKLEYLAYKYGFFYEGHRATIDCQAGIEILSQALPASNEPVLKRLLEYAKRVDIRLFAEGAPFDKKDDLKKRGYRWSPGGPGSRKAWYIDLLESELDSEMVYLNQEIFPRAVGSLPTEKYTAKERYSRR